MRSGHERLPLGKSCQAAFFISLTVGEVAFLIEVVVKRGGDGSELWERLNLPEPEHCAFSSSYEQVAGCCQSNANLSPANEAGAEDANSQAAILFHLANATERRSLYDCRSVSWRLIFSEVEADLKIGGPLVGQDA